MGSYTAENSPLLSCYLIPPLDADGQLITFVGQREGGGCCWAEEKKNPKFFGDDSGGFKEGKKNGIFFFGGSCFS